VSAGLETTADKPVRGAPGAHGGPAQQGAKAQAAVITHGLTKRFRGGQLAVDGLDMVVPRGSVYGFLGPNGSGKTTTIRMLLGLVFPTSGNHELLDTAMPAGAARVLPRVGSLVEGPAFYTQLSGRANLARIDAVDATADPATTDTRVTAALERVGLLAAAKKRYRAYSLGMKQRLAIAASLLQPRELIILDEPTNGLDPQGTREVRGLLTALAATGTTVVLSTHLLSEVEQICSHVGVMHLGRLVAQGPLAQLRARTAPRVQVRSADPAGAARVLTEQGLTEVVSAGDAVTGLLNEVVPEKLVAALVHADVPVRGFEVQAADLEEMFVQLTGEGFDVSG
jgi:ABC-2 type transport system ATP-binding protein